MCSLSSAEPDRALQLHLAFRKPPNERSRIRIYLHRSFPPTIPAVVHLTKATDTDPPAQAHPQETPAPDSPLDLHHQVLAGLRMDHPLRRRRLRMEQRLRMRRRR